MKERTTELLDTLTRLAANGNKYAEALMFSVVTADDPDAKADAIIESVAESARRLNLWAREHQDEIYEWARQNEADANK